MIAGKAPQRARPAALTAKTQQPGHAFGHERHAAPGAGVGAGHPAVGHGGRAAAGVGGLRPVERGGERGDEVGRDVDVGVEVDADAAGGGGVADVEGVQLAALRHLEDGQAPAARGGRGLEPAGGAGGVVAAAVGDHQHLDRRRRQAVRGEERRERRADVGGLVAGGDDDAAGAGSRQFPGRKRRGVAQRRSGLSRWRRGGTSPPGPAARTASPSREKR